MPRSYLRVMLAALSMLGTAGLAAQSPIDSFAPDINGDVRCVAVQADGRILIAGSFTEVNGESISGLARLNVDGSVDTNFTPNPDGAVFAIAPQPDGRILVGGAFTQVGGQGVARLARLESGGGGAGGGGGCSGGRSPVLPLAAGLLALLAVSLRRARARA